jgi:hypothetical protein
MRARIGMALGPYWGSIMSTLDIIAAISALGAIGGLSALLHSATPYARHAMKWLQKTPTADGSSHRQRAMLQSTDQRRSSAITAPVTGLRMKRSICRSSSNMLSNDPVTTSKDCF